jgi:tRNA(Ile)-lysidine synthase
MSLEARVRAEGLLRPGAPVLVLLSGGPDSVCLLDLARRVSGEVTALHVDYGLRDSSAEDAAHCDALCARLGVPLHVHRPRRPEGNLQAWARDVRYAEALRLAEGDVAAGHTASDQVETVLYRLAASPGRRALLGMRPRDGRVIRPLLGAWRADTEAWCAEHGLPWREDPTNATDAYARNRARHRLVPALRELHPAAEANVLRTLELLRDEAQVLDAAVEAVFDADLAHLRALPPALARLVIVRLAGGAAVGHRADEILALGEHGALDVGGGLRARIERGRVEFVPTPPRVRA